MSKLFKLKQWLTIGETAKHLSNVLSEPVSEADVLQLCLDELLTLSVYIPQPLNVMVWKGGQDKQALYPDPETIIGLHDLLLDFGNGAEELQYRLKALHTDSSDKPDKSVVYLLGNNDTVYELPVNSDLDIVVRTGCD